MGMRRGVWNPETFNKAAATKTGRYGARPATIVKDGVSNSEHYLINRGLANPDDAIPEGISDHRREELIRATDTRQEQNNPSPLLVYSNSYKRAQEIKETYGLTKSAAISTSSDGTQSVSSGGTVRQAPEVYSPLFQIANLQLPRDRITMNAWNRNFYDTHPLVHNCVNLHATYPISKINIKCKDRQVEQFFKDMTEEIDLINILQAVALEFFKMGECFPYAELDENAGMWKNIIIQNPDYIHVKTAVLSGDSVISMRPDAALQRLVQSSNPADIQLRKQIDEEVLYHVKKGNNIPLDNFHVSHLSMKSSPYDIHGTSPIVTIYKDLMLYDKLRECHSQDTEIIAIDTKTHTGGIYKGLDIIEYNLVDGKPENARIKDGLKIACFNPKNNKIEYHKPTNVHLSHYKGKMIHFNGKKIDAMVTPNHRMWVKKKKKNGWTDWYFEKAKNISKAYYYKFKSCADWEGKKEETVLINNYKIPIEDYLSFLGYIISEGCVYQNYKDGRYDNSITINQLTKSKYYQKMRQSINKIAKHMDKKCKNGIRIMGAGYSKNCQKETWTAKIHGKDIVNHFINEIGTDGKCGSYDKKIPRWVLDLDIIYLKVLLDALVDGDGSRIQSKYKEKSTQFRYCTVSKQLADDVYELVYKCGYVPNVYTIQRPDRDFVEYTILWSDTNYGNEPLVYGNPNHGGANIDQIDYDGLVWCFEVPTGLFVTRRNGKITIQGNSKFAQADNLVNPITLIKVGGNADGEYRPSDDDLEKWRQMFEAAQYDKDFKIITHAGVDVNRVGASGTIIDIGNDMTFILDNILHGLMVPKSVITQEGASFNSATVGLEVLKQRYESFRNMMAQWLTKKIFAPISEIQEFYEYKDGDKKLIVPEVEWNRMILFDMDNYINVLNGLVGQMSVSKTTLFRSLGLNVEEERRLIKEEAINQSIVVKEAAILQGMTLGALRALKPDEDIIEQTEVALPGTPGAMPGEDAGMPGGMPGAGALPSLGPAPMGGGAGGMPPMPAGGVGMPPLGLGAPTGPGAGISQPAGPGAAPKPAGAAGTGGI